MIVIRLSSVIKQSEVLQYNTIHLFWRAICSNKLFVGSGNMSFRHFCVGIDLGLFECVRSSACLYTSVFVSVCLSTGMFVSLSDPLPTFPYIWPSAICPSVCDSGLHIWPSVRIRPSVRTCVTAELSKYCNQINFTRRRPTYNDRNQPDRAALHFRLKIRTSRRHRFNNFVFLPGA